MIPESIIIPNREFYEISVAKELPFSERFLEMAGLSLTVAAVSFGIGFLVKKSFNLEL